MEFTFIMLYLFFYLLSLLIFLVNIILFFPLFFYSKFSFFTLIIYIKNYTSNIFYLYVNFFLLAGLPPVSLFFLKLNFIIYLLNYISLFSLFLYFIFFFLNMLFYLWIFKYKINWSYNNYLILDNIFQSSWNLININLKKNFLNYSSLMYINKYYTYNFIYFITINIFFLFLNFFFFIDIYLIFYNYCFLN